MAGHRPAVADVFRALPLSVKSASADRKSRTNAVIRASSKLRVNGKRAGSRVCKNAIEREAKS